MSEGLKKKMKAKKRQKLIRSGSEFSLRESAKKETAQV